MITIRLTGRITEDGKLEVELPDNLPPGNVEVLLEVANSADLPGEPRPWTDEEIAELTKPGKPATGAEIVALLEKYGGWEDIGITDSVAWLEEQRRKRRERNQW